METSPSALAQAIRARRDELDMSVEDAAARANISARSWRVIEQGESLPSVLMLGSVCRALQWTSEMIEGLLHGDLRVEEGHVVVDLGSREPEPEPVAEPEPEPEPIELDVDGLTPAQLVVVQEYIDMLRGFSNPSD